MWPSLGRPLPFRLCSALGRRTYKTMTVAGLWPLLKQRGLVRTAAGAEARELLEGKRVAVDVSAWAVQGLTMEASRTTRSRHFLATSFWRVARYLRVGCLPVAVLEGKCPSTKRRRRLADGDFQRNLELVAELFNAMGCPIFRAAGEAEGCCAQLSRTAAVDAIESPDSDLFPFGARGCILKSVDSNGACAWHIEHVDAEEVSESQGLGQQGWIAVAALAGCDFLPIGAKGVGIEKGLRCINAILRHCGEGKLQEFLLASLDNGLPPEIRGLTALTGCKACRRCGHGSVGKLQHGRLGCSECGTLKALGGEGGCLPRSGPCPCEFHRRHDEIVLARTFETTNALPRRAGVETVWRVYDGDPPLENVCVTWKRPGLEAAALLLSNHCGSSRQDTVTYMLPSVLAWDFVRPGDPEAQFGPAAVCGECSAGLSPSEKTLPAKALAVVEWGALPGRAVPESLLRASAELPRVKRSVSKRLALQHCPRLVEDFCREELAKKVKTPNLRAALKNREHWEAEAHALCCGRWGLPRVPDAISADIAEWAAAWADSAPPPPSKKKQRTLNNFFQSASR